MTPSEYEEYVSYYVRQLDFCKNATISRNRKFKGKRQPGEYEIDIAVEMNFSEKIYFLIIIECKYWKRVVDRPVIQSLAQTKDAISAHKAIAAAPKGFSKEAKEVAEAHSIELWQLMPQVLRKDDFADEAEAPAFSSSREREVPLLSSITLNDKDKVKYRMKSLGLIERLYLRLCSALGLKKYDLSTSSGPLYFELYYDLRSDFRSVITDEYIVDERVNQIIGDIYIHITSFDNWRKIESLENLAQWEDSALKKIMYFRASWPKKIILKADIKLLYRFKKPDPLMKDILQSVASDDYETFRKLMKTQI
jgi:restriction endonuclease